MSKSQQRLDSLEKLIDCDSLSEVLSDIASICYAKAAHIEEVWQDANTAKVWWDAGERMEKAAEWSYRI